MIHRKSIQIGTKEYPFKLKIYLIVKSIIQLEGVKYRRIEAKDDLIDCLKKQYNIS